MTAVLAKVQRDGQRDTQGLKQFQSKNYYPSLDGLRGLAALMVVYGHWGYAGWVPLVVGCASIGVVLFFFLSGFLMGHHYLPDASSGIANTGTMRYWLAFLMRRFLRVYPPYVFAPIAGYLLLMPRMPPDFEQSVPYESLSVLGEIAKIATFEGNLGIYWTIKAELFFYLLYPLIITLCLMCRSKVLTLSFVFVALVFLNHFPLGVNGVTWNIPLPFFYTGYTSVFVAGVLTAVISKRSPGRPDTGCLHWNALAAISFIVLAMVVAVISRSSPTHGTIWRLEWLFAALFFVMFLSLVQSNGLTGKFLSSRYCAFIGRTSYSLYLTHIIAMHIVFERVSPAQQGIVAAAIVLFVLTLVYYTLVERPFVILSKGIKVKYRSHHPEQIPPPWL